MIRTNSMPDAIFCGVQTPFTQIPNDLLRNPNISGKAKAIQCLLLSNKEGWKSHTTTIKKMMLEGFEAIRSGLYELEKHGYLVRLPYREKKTKIRRGTIWAYTDTPHVFNILQKIDVLEKQGFEIVEIDRMLLQPGDLDLGELDVENRALKRLTKKEQEKNYLFSPPPPDKKQNDKIVPGDFDKFWEMYPSSRRGTKGTAWTAWLKLCRAPNGSRPDWQRIRAAIIKQKKSERWIHQTHYIPLAATWLNKSRWLDDPNDLTLIKDYNGESATTETHVESTALFRRKLKEELENE